MTSKIKVDNIADQNDNNIINESGDVITVGASGDTVAVAGNIVKSNAYQASDGGNIVSQSGTTITLGASGDTVSLASGASQSGFGRTGTVDWQTGSIKTATFTAANGEGYFANTSGGAFTMNLPAGTAGNIVSVVDYTNTFQTNSLTISPNGSQKLGGVAAPSVLSTEGQSITLVYVDDTEGWKNVQDSTSNVIGSPYIVASGGTESTTGNFKIHKFTGPGTFTVSCAGTPDQRVDYLVLGGGGGGGDGAGSSVDGGGGGGAGGFRASSGGSSGCYTAGPSPLTNGVSGLPVTAQGYPIVVGGGGPTNVDGNLSSFSTISSAGGGGGGNGSTQAKTGKSGGSGGGGNTSNGAGGSGNTPPVSPPQGNDGGDGGPGDSGGGGGAGGVGQDTPGSTPGIGGSGVTSCITASPVPLASGGDGSPTTGPTGPNQAANSGKGGPGAGHPGRNGGSGGSGIVVIRYRYQ